MYLCPCSDEPEVQITDTMPLINSFDLNLGNSEFSNALFKYNKELYKLYRDSTNFYLLMSITDNLLFNENQTKNLLDFIETMKKEKFFKIMKQFKNINEMKKFKKKLFKKLNHCPENNQAKLKCEKDKEKYQSQLKFVNEAVNKGLMQILYAKEFCDRIDELYGEDSIKLILYEFCVDYVDEITDLILGYAGIEFTLKKKN
uniref:Uncharacterized protein n=1 Tax=Meloidogyne hapla TaxID=6305 RepID=A0A1I8BKZ5_MELHA